MPSEMAQSFVSMGVMDGAACALLAAAATTRAKGFGAHGTGALVLGCLCGILGPLLREAFLHGAPAAGRIASELPAGALVGALGGLAGFYMFSRINSLRGRLFGWLDGASMAAATSVGSIMSVTELGIVGALTLGLINGLAPGLVRDMALGDTAMLVEKSWYATAAALGCAASLAMLVFLGAGHINDWAAANVEAVSVITGFMVIVCIRAWRMGQEKN